MLQFMTDFQLKTILDVTPFRPAGSDVRSLFNLPLNNTFTVGEERMYLRMFSINPIGEDLMIAKIDGYTEEHRTSSVWRSLHAMKETGYREFSKCIEVNLTLITTLDFSGFNGMGDCDCEILHSEWDERLFDKYHPRGCYDTDED